MQLDVKLTHGIPLNILIEALDRAKIGRNTILDIMEKGKGHDDDNSNSDSGSDIKNGLICRHRKPS